MQADLPLTLTAFPQLALESCCRQTVRRGSSAACNLWPYECYGREHRGACVYVRVYSRVFVSSLQTWCKHFPLALLLTVVEVVIFTFTHLQRALIRCCIAYSNNYFHPHGTHLVPDPRKSVINPAWCHLRL